MKRVYLSFLTAAGLVVGCSNGAVEDESASEMVTVTSVTPEGVSTVTLTAAQAAQQRELLARSKADAQAGVIYEPKSGAVQPEFVLDTHCLATSLYLYDQPNQSGNLICFTDISGVTATADLLKYTYPGGGSWAGNQRALGLMSRVKSYWGGRQAAVGGCQDSVGHNPVSCHPSTPFEMMSVYGQGNISSNLRTIVEYHPVE